MVSSSLPWQRSSHRHSIRWPVCLWLSQLAIPAAVLVYGMLRVLHGPPPGKRLVVMVGVCGLWVAAVVTVLLLRRTRLWLVAHRRQLALCFAAALLTLAVCDIGLTLSGAVPTIAALRASSLEYGPSVCSRHRLVPKTFSVAGRDGITINSRGYLGPEIAIPKPAGTTRIVFLGESQTFGTFWSEGENWPETVGQVLTRRGLRVDVINAAVPGHQTGDSLGKLVADLWMTEPDIIVVCHAWNDIKYFSEVTPTFPYCDAAPPWTGTDWRLHPQGLDWLLCTSAFYRMGHNSLVTMLKGAGDEGEKLREPSGHVSEFAVRQYRLNLETICDVGRNIGATVVLCKQARLPVAGSAEEDKARVPYEYVGLAHDELLRAFAACDRAVDEVAAERGCRVIDMSGPMSGKAGVFADHIHFSVEGSRQAAQLVADALAPLCR